MSALLPADPARALESSRSLNCIFRFFWGGPARYKHADQEGREQLGSRSTPSIRSVFTRLEIYLLGILEGKRT